MIDPRDSQRPPADEILNTIADYVLHYRCESQLAIDTARLCFLDSMACAFMALKYKNCTKLLGPIIEGTLVPNGARVPGTEFILDPQRAAFDISLLIRWLDYNDTWLAAEWGHPSDNLGAILALGDHLNRRSSQHATALHCSEIYQLMIKAYEIQGVIALENSFNQVGLDHVILVRIASTAVASTMLGCNHKQIVNALSNAWIDGAALRCYRHAPNTGTRKSWAAADACARGVQHAYFATANEMGYPSALSATQWGFYDVLFKGNSFTLEQAFGSYVMENILFKISYPAEFHAQTALEAAILLHPQVHQRLDKISKIVIETQSAGKRIIDKTGPLDNPADRDHCIQYIVAVALINGRLSADDYEDDAAQDSRIDELRNKMIVQENPLFTEAYYDPNQRAIANSVQIYFQDDSMTEKVDVHYPIGHRRRRTEALKLLDEKFQNAVNACFDSKQSDAIQALFFDAEKLARTPVEQLMSLISKS